MSLVLAGVLFLAGGYLVGYGTRSKALLNWPMVIVGLMVFGCGFLVQ